MTERPQRLTRFLILSILVGALAGCAAPATEPTVLPTPTVPSGWERYVQSGQCSYMVDHPAGMDAAVQGTYNLILSFPAAESGGSIPNWVYISVIPDDFQSTEPGTIYNYDPAETQTLLNMQVGESKSLREDPNLADWFSYTRLADTKIGNQTAQAYENTQPWEFPPGTKELRYYLKKNGCTYLVGGYLSTVGSGQPGAMDQVLFDQIIASFLPVP